MPISSNSCDLDRGSSVRAHRRLHGRHRRLWTLLLLVGMALAWMGTVPMGSVHATPPTPGLPFQEDFSTTTFQDPAQTSANWSTDEKALILAWQKKLYGAFGTGIAGSDISVDSQQTRSLAVGDVDGDGDLDLIAGNNFQTNKLYLNNGTSDPFNNVTGSDISADIDRSHALALADVDGDGDLDLIAGNIDAANKVYLNNGSATPFSGVTGSTISSDAHTTRAIALSDVDGDGDLDLIVGNEDQTNRLYLNNGSANPFSGVVGSDISSNAHTTLALALGDVDGDGDLDLIVGNQSQTNRLYLNNGSATPYSGVTGSDISSDAHNTTSLALGDVDGDGDLDLAIGNQSQTNRLYLNNGSVTPYSGVTGSDIGADTQETRALALGDVDGDGDLDLIAVNYNQTSKLYINSGTTDPFGGVSDSDITTDAGTSYALILADVDGDGDLDLIVGNELQRNRLYLNDSSDNPWTGVAGSDISTDSHPSYALALGDVDGDGDLDLIAGNFNQRNRLYLNNGTADPFNGVTGSDISVDLRQTTSLALGDVDRDGDLDLIVGNQDQTNRLFLNNGTLTPFSGVAGSDISSDAHYTRALALSDVDGDGDLDLIVANGNSQRNRLYLNNGTSTPFNGVNGSDVSTDNHTTLALAVGDVDGDGDPDLVVGNSNQTNRLYLNNGSGVFGSGSDITVDSHNTWSIALADVDGDGDLDLIVGNQGLNRLYVNSGTGTFDAGSDISSDNHSTLALALGDVDGDGDLDFIAGNSGRANVLYLNNGTATPFSGVVGSAITSDSHTTYDLALGDVDGDGDLDLVVGNNGQTNRLNLNIGNVRPFRVIAGTGINSGGHATESIAIGDVDGDGDLDLIAGNDGQVNQLYQNNGTTAPFSGVTGSDISGDTSATHALALGDVDGDGDLDLIVGNHNQVNRLYLNNGTATPFAGVAGSDIGSDAHSTSVVLLADVEGDGDLDLIVGNDNQVNRLYLNNGSGVFGSGSAVSSDAHSTRAVALGDVDGDGDLDLIAGNGPTETNRLYLNNGSGVFGGGSDITADSWATYALALGDVDGDGDLDLIAGNSQRPNRLYLNNGSGVFGSGSDITLDIHDTRDVALGDVDGDGDLDLIAGNNGQVNRLYLNNGGANPFNGVSGSDITNDVHSTLALALGDVDGDGALDLIAGNGTQMKRLYQRRIYNTARGWGGSLEVDNQTFNIPQVTLNATEALSTNTGIEYWLSNNGGVKWYLVRNGKSLLFPTAGSDLRWRAQLRSLSPVQTPRLGLLRLDPVPFNLTSHVPVTNAVGVAVTQNITAAFDTALDATTVTSRTLTVRSSFRGLFTETATVSGNGLTLDPGRNFFAGEQVQVVGTAGVRNVAGALLDPTQWGFTAGPVVERCVGGFSDVGAGLPGVQESSVAWGDYDNDGDLDILFAGTTNFVASGALVNVYRNDGGSFTDINAGLPGVYRSSVAWGDYDSDGDLDILLSGTTSGNASGGLVKVYRNDGDSFNDTGAGLSGAFYGDLAWGDYDNDGDLDILLAGLDTEGNRVAKVYRNDGGGFSDIGAGLPGVFRGSVAWGDYDNDGDLDILLTGDYGSSHIAEVYRNDGGSFSAVGAGLPGVQFSSVAWGDYDNDGDLDILLTGVSRSGRVARVYRNDGGSFSTISAELTGVHNSSVAWGDYDNDGDLDILLTGFPGVGRIAEVLRNDSGNFSDVGAGLPGVQFSSVAWGDYDNDGDLDILFTGQDSSNSQLAKIYRNDNCADVSLTKSVNPSGAQPGAAITYTLSFSNTGPDVARGVVISDSMPASVSVTGVTSSTFGGASITQTSSGPNFAWSAGDLPVGAGGWITLTGTVANNPSLAGTLITNTATITASNDITATNNSSSAGLTLFRLTSHVPVTNAVGVNLNQSISAAFNANLDGSSVTSRTFTVRSSFRGLFTETATVSGSGLTLDPGRDFFAGEQVQVVGTAGVRNVDGAPLDPTQWGFTAGPVIERCVGGFSDVGAGLPRVLSSSVAWGDYDGDGDLDILIAGTTSFDASGALAKVFRNDGSSFTDINAGLPGVYRTGVAWGDYDSDGDLDILLSGRTGGNPRDALLKVFRNDGGSFTDIGAGLTGVSTGDVAWGDYDNDGDLDILLAGFDSDGNRVAKVYRNDGGSFSDIGAGLPGVYQSSVAWGDYDNDGDLDILLTGTGSGNNYISEIYRNDGGSFNSISAGLPGVYSGSVAWGDYDNDGDLDILITGSPNSGMAEVYRNDGGSFSTISAELPGVRFSSVAWGDYDNDGDLDILLTGGSSGNNRISEIYRNDGGSFNPISASLPGVYNSSVAWGDYDNDGDLDILLTGQDNSSSQVAKLYRNNGCADVSLTKSVNPSGAQPGAAITYTLSFSNIGPDVARSVVISDSVPVSVTVTGVTSSTFGGASLAQTSGSPNFAWSAGDLPVGAGGSITLTGSVANNPALVGTAFTNTATITASNDITVTNNSGSAGLTLFRLTSHVPVTNAVGVNLNQSISAAFNTNLDGSSVTSRTFTVRSSFRGLFTETATVSGSGLTLDPGRNFFAGEQVQVVGTAGVRSSGGAPLDPTQWGFTAGPVVERCVAGFSPIGTGLTNVALSSVAWGDYDNDGDLDILITGRDASANYLAEVYRNTGGSFSAIGAGLPGVAYGSVAWGDYDNDGDLDILFSGSTTGATVDGLTKVYRNDGGGFTDIGPSFSNVSAGSVAWGDYDNDGDLDILLTGLNGFNALSRVYRNDGGTFSAIGAGLPDIGYSSVAWGDYDSDGDLDILLAGFISGGRVAEVYRNDSGSFSAVGAGLPDIGYSSVAWGDYDSDGDLDILLSGESTGGGVAEVYRNDGGSFTVVGAGLPGVARGSVAWGDYDNDGDLDILITGLSGSPVAEIYRNDGGTFSAVGTGLPGVSFGSVVWGDYDNDGDLDILLSGASTGGAVAEVYRNDNCADVSLTKSVNPSGAQPGAPITYTLSFSNSGPDVARGVVISDSVPVSVTVTGVTSSTFGGASINQTSSGPNFAWSAGDLPVSAGGWITLTGTVVNNAALAGTTFTNTATITASNDITVTKNVGLAALYVPVVSLAISPESMNEDAAGALTLTFTRTGAPDFIADPLTVNFDVGGTAAVGSDYAQSGAASYASGTGSAIIPGGSNSVAVTLDPAADSTVELDETVVISLTGGAYVIGAGGVVTGTIANDDSVALGISKTASDLLPAESTVVTYTVVVSNTGSGIATGVRVSDTNTDTLASGITLQPGEVVSYTYSLVRDDGPATVVNTATVTASEDLTGIAASVTVVWQNVDPTAALGNNGPVNGGQTAEVTFSNQSDPSSADRAALRYSYDFGADGSYEILDSTSPTAIVPAGYSSGVTSYSVRGRITDDDGGSNEYETTIEVVPPTATPTPSPTSTPTATPTATATATATATPTSTPTASATATTTPTPTSTATSTATPTPPATASTTATSTSTATATPTSTATATNIPSATPSPTGTPSATSTPTSTPSATPTSTVTSTATPSATSTASPTSTATPTNTPSATPSPTSTRVGPITAVTATPTATPSATPTNTPSATPSPTSTATVTPSATPTSTATSTPTSTVTPSATSTTRPTGTSTPTNTPSATPSPTSTATASPTNTPTVTATATSTPTATPTDLPPAPVVGVSNGVETSGAAADGIVTVGQAVSFTVQVRNDGVTPLVSVPFSYSYDATQLELLSAEPAPDSTSSGLLSWSDLTGAGELAPGVSLEVRVGFRALASTSTVAAAGVTPSGTSTTARVENARDSLDRPAATVEATASVRITEPRVQIAKRLSAGQNGLVATGRVSYTLVISNAGDTTLTSVGVEDLFDPAELSLVETISNANQISDGQVGWSDVTEALGDIAPGGAVELQVVFDVASGADEIPNLARITAAVDENGDQADPVQGESVLSLPVAEMTLTYSGDPAPGENVAPGECIDYTLTVSNTGAVDLTGVTLSAPVPEGTTGVDECPAASTPALIAAGAQPERIIPLGDLAVGGATSARLRLVVDGDIQVQIIRIRGEATSDQTRPIFFAWQGVNPLDPTAVTLLGFSARPSSGGVQVRWMTGQEVGSFGFHLWRSAAGFADAVRVTGDIVPATGAGSEYGYVDAKGKIGDRYWLEEVQLDGESRWYGPVLVAASGSAMMPRIYLPMVGR